MKIGRMIFYDSLTGDVLIDTGEIVGSAVKKTVDQQIATYKKLSDRNRDTFEYIELDFGAYSQDFTECNGYRVNVKTKMLEFSYPDPNEPTLEQPYQESLSGKVKQLELAQSVTDTTILELMESLLQ